MLEEYKIKKKAIKHRLNQFSKVKGNDIFYELCFCVCTPQSNAKKCWAAVCELKKKDFLNKNLKPNLKGKVRFHNNKAKYLMKIKKEFPKIKQKIKEIKDPVLLREWLVKNVKGLGYKEASHFLRNIGYKNLAIIDRHILANLKANDVINSIPKTITKRKYLEIEKKFLQFAKKTKISMDELDLLFWSRQTGEIFK